MRNDPTVTNIFDLDGRRYPHMKVTNERYPRALATRAIEDDEAEYHGAFLPKTAARILIDFLNKTFRLRTCDIPIDGSFPMPCTQYYRRRCVAPCVAKLCSHERYMARVALVRAFLANKRPDVRFSLKMLIKHASDRLDFENAAVYRDIMEACERFWKNTRQRIWLDDAVDTFVVEDTPAGITIYLVTHRGTGVLGRKVFVVGREDYESPDEAISSLIEGFYVTHLAREIRVSRPFSGRRELAHKLSLRFDRDARITIANPAKKGINAYRGIILSHDEHELDRARPQATPARIAGELAKRFGLNRKPQRVEAFDVAHISGTGFVAAWSIWDNGKFLSADFGFEISPEQSELDALAAAVERRIAAPTKAATLILLDGGKPQMNAVLKRLQTLTHRPPIIAAVKPKGRHSAVAAFITEDGGSHPFDIDSPSHAMLQLLRDEAHDLANRVHRDYREMMPFYEKAGFERPLVVPLRFHAENGGAEDLLPIDAR